MNLSLPSSETASLLDRTVQRARDAALQAAREALAGRPRRSTDDRLAGAVAAGEAAEAAARPILAEVVPDARLQEALLVPLVVEVGGAAWAEWWNVPTAAPHG